MNKFNKGKLVGIVAASLSAVSLMGVGFASWLIEGSQNATTNNGITVEVGSVTDNRISITGVSVTEGAIAFDAAANDTDGAILKKTGDGVEDLSFTITYTVNNTNATNKFHVFAYIATANQEAFTTATSEQKKLITMPTALNITETGTPTNSVSFNGTAITFAEGASRQASETGNGTVTVTQTFTFGWGQAFGGINPSAVLTSTDVYDIHNNKMGNASEDILKNNINELATLKNGLSTFKVVLQPEIVNA